MHAHHAGSSVVYWAGLFIAAGSSIVHCTLAYLYSPVFSAIFGITVNPIAALLVVIMIFVAIMSIYVKFASREQPRDSKNDKRGMYMGAGIISASTTIFMLFLIPLIESIHSNSLLFNPSLQLSMSIIYEVFLVAALPFVIFMLVPLVIFYTIFMKQERHREPMDVDHARAIILVIFLSSVAFSVIFIPFISIFVILAFGIIIVMFKKNALKWHNQPLEDHDLVKRVMAIIFMLTTTMTMFFFSTPLVPLDAIAIAVLGMILYWFAMNKNRVQQKRVASGLLLGLSITMALVPVIVDRDLFRSGTSSVTIVRSVPGNASAEIIRVVEGFNATAQNNWTFIPQESFTEPLFSGKELVLYSSYVASFQNIAPEPILYLPSPHGTLDYVMSGTIFSGNISTMYTNSTLVLRANGTSIFDSNKSLQDYYSHFYYLNSSVFSKPGAHETIVNQTNGYLVTLNVTYVTGCEWARWQQWYFLQTPVDIAWVFAGSAIATC